MRTPPRRKFRQLVFFLSFLAFPWSLNLMSPYLSVAGAWAGVVAGSVLFFAALFLTAPSIGRSFCSWACPGGFAQEAVAGVRTKKAGSPAFWRVKWFVWAPWLVALVSGWGFAGLKAVIPDWNPGYPATQDFLTSVGAGTLMATAVTVLLVIPALIFGRRASCHTLCWTAPFMILGRKLGRALHLPGLTLTVQNEACVACGLCTKACPMGVPVQTLVATKNAEHRECILCADCVDTCPKQVLSITFRGA